MSIESHLKNNPLITFFNKKGAFNKTTENGMEKKQPVNIVIQIKYGKTMEYAGFLVHNFQGSIICDGMSIDGKPMMQKTVDQYVGILRTKFFK